MRGKIWRVLGAAVIAALYAGGSGWAASELTSPVNVDGGNIDTIAPNAYYLSAGGTTIKHSTVNPGQSATAVLASGSSITTEDSGSTAADLTIQSEAAGAGDMIFQNAGTINVSGGDLILETGAAGTGTAQLENTGTVSVTGTAGIQNDGEITNAGGTVQFGAGTSYSGAGTFSNQGGTLYVNTGMAGTSMDDVLGAIGTGATSDTSYGTVNVYGNIAGGTDFDGLSGTSLSGDVYLTGHVGTDGTSRSNIDVGSNGNIHLAGGDATMNYIGDVTGKTFTVDASKNADVDGALTGVTNITSNGNLILGSTVANTVTLSTGAGGSMTLSGTVADGVTYQNNGAMVSKTAITISDLSKYSGAGKFDNTDSAASLTLTYTDATKTNSIYSGLTSAAGGNIGDVTIAAGSTGLDNGQTFNSLSGATSGQVTFDNTLGATSAVNIDVGGAGIGIDGAGTNQLGSVTAGSLLVDTNRTAVVSGALSSGLATLTVNSGGSLTLDSGVGTVTDKAITLGGTGALVNKANIVFTDLAKYTGTATSTFDNTAGNLTITYTAATSGNNIYGNLTAAAAGDIGNITIAAGSTELDNGQTFNSLSGATSGQVTFDNTLGATSAVNIDVGGAGVGINGAGTNQLADVTASALTVNAAKTAVVTGTLTGVTTITANGNLTLDTALTPVTSMVTGASGVLTLESGAGTVTDKTIANAGSVVNKTDVVYTDLTKYSGAGKFDNTDSAASLTLTYTDATKTNSIYSGLVGAAGGNIGDVTITGNNGLTDGTLGHAFTSLSGATSGSVTFDSQLGGTNAIAVNVGTADAILDGAGNQITTLAAGDVTTNGATSFGGAVAAAGSITANANTTFNNTVATGAAGLIINNATVTLGTNGVLTNPAALNLANANAVLNATASTSPLTVASLEGLAGSQVQLGANKNFTVTNGANTTYAGDITGTGTSGLTLSGGALTLTGTNTYTGATTINGNGALTGHIGTGALVNNSSAAAGYTLTANQSVASLEGTGATNLATHTLTVTGNDNKTYSGVLSGTGGVTIGDGVSAARQTLNNANTYSGATTIAAGSTLFLGANGSLANSNIAMSGVGASTFDISAGSNRTAVVNGLSGGVAASQVNLGSNTLDVAGGTGAYTGAIAGTGGLTVSGAGTTLDLTNAVSNYTGATTIKDSAALTGVIGTGALVNNSSALAGFTLTDDQSVASIEGTGDTDLNGFDLTVTGNANKTYSGALANGGLIIGNGTAAASQTLAGDNSGLVSTDVAKNAVLTIDGTSANPAKHGGTMNVAGGGILNTGANADFSGMGVTTLVAGSSSSIPGGAANVNIRALGIDSLLNNMNLGAWSNLNLDATGGLVMDGSNVGDYQVNTAAANSAIAFKAGSGTNALTLDGATYDARSANLVLSEGVFNLDTASGPAGFTTVSNIAGADAAARSAFILGQNATLNVLGGGLNDAVIAGGVGGTASMRGTIAFDNAQGGLDLTSFSKVFFGPNANLNLVAANGSISTIDAQAFDFTAGRTNVTITGNEADAVAAGSFLSVNGTQATEADAGTTILGGGNLYSAIYNLTPYGAVLGAKPKHQTFYEMFGIYPLSNNEFNLATYMDMQYPYAKTLANNYVNLVGATTLGYSPLAKKAIDQAGLEYAATVYFEPLQAINKAVMNIDADNFFGLLRQSMALADAGGSSVDALAAMPSSRSALAYQSGGRRAIDCGGYYTPGNFQAWASYIGSWDKQDSKNSIAGYKLDGNGIATGLNYHLGRFTFGAFGAYMYADTKVDDLSANFNTDLMNLGLFANYIHESGFYGRLGYTYGHGWNDYDVNMVVWGTKSGDYNTSSHTAYTELGYVWRLPAQINLIPSLGIRYTHYRSKGWTESVSGNPFLFANYVDKFHDNGLDLPLQVAVNKTFQAGSVAITPEVRVGYTYAAAKVDPTITGGMVGGVSGYVSDGITPGRSRFTVGTGVTANINRIVDVNVNYNFECRSKYWSHTLNAGVGINF